MSRIGKEPITIPAGVTVTIEAGNVVTVKGPKGTLTYAFSPALTIENEANMLSVKRPNDEAMNRALHGTTRALLNDMVIGVTDGFARKLEINGVGYRAQKQGNNLVMNLGYSHQVIMPEVEGIHIEVPSANQIVISGADKQLVGQFAADVRKKRPPEPYKGKGIKYEGEKIRRKSGKTGK